MPRRRVYAWLESGDVAEVPFDAFERQQLCELFVELGPDAPTLLEPWSTRDLAAHLVVGKRQTRRHEKDPIGWFRQPSVTGSNPAGHPQGTPP
jgi:hypothetical protein